MRSRPNLLFIHVDQQRYDCLGFTGHPLVKTPHLDKLRAESVSFTNAFSPIPLCCPARQTLLCGVMPEVHGGLWNYDTQLIPGLATSFPTWTKLLKESGMVMSYFGKWHVHPDFDPTCYGYDLFEGEKGLAPNEVIQKFAMPENSVWPHTGKISILPLEQSPTHEMTSRAIKQLEKYTKSDTPWHIRLDFNEPHLPCIPSEPFASMYPPAEIPEWINFRDTFKNKPYIQKQQLKNWEIENWTWKEWSYYLSTYFGIISQTDHAIGKILKALDDSGQRENTIVIYTTDHGDAAGSHRMIDKHYVMYEEEVHVPLLIRWPGMIEPGSTCEDFVMNALDLGPTILECYGIHVPSSFQGKSVAFPITNGKGGIRIENSKWDVAFSSYHGQQFGLYDMRMVRDGRYKYVFNPTDTDEFYDLKNDPAELNNLAGTEIDRVLGPKYRAKVYEVFSGLGDRLMTKSTWMKNRLTKE